MTAAEFLGRVTAEVSEAIEGMFNNFLGGVMGTIQKEKGIKERRLLKKQVIDMIELTHVSAQRLYVDFDRKLEWSNRLDSIFNEEEMEERQIEKKIEMKRQRFRRFRRWMRCTSLRRIDV